MTHFRFSEEKSDKSCVWEGDVCTTNTLETESFKVEKWTMSQEVHIHGKINTTKMF